MLAQGKESFLKRNLGFLLLVGVLLVLPFVLALLNGQSIPSLLANEDGDAKFLQGLLIEVFILAAFAISYDLVLGVTGLLSFGHGMFFAFGAYLTGILLKSFGWPLWQVVIAAVVAGVLQALLFGIVLPRVKGITFALVTLGIAAVFDIMVRSQELGKYHRGRRWPAGRAAAGVPQPSQRPFDLLLRYFWLRRAGLSALQALRRLAYWPRVHCQSRE